MPRKPDCVSFQRVLVALELSQHSVAAAPFAIELARLYGPNVSVALMLPKNWRPDVHSALTETVRKSLAQDDVPNEVAIDRSTIAQQFPAIVKSVGAEIVVLCVQSAVGLDKVFHGSWAQEITCSVGVPVVSIGKSARGLPHLRSVLYVTDFSPASEHAFVYAQSLAKRFAAKLICLHVNDGTDEPAAMAEQKLFEFLRDRVDELEIGTLDLDRDVLVRFGAQANEILSVAGDRDADLIVVGLKCKQ